MVVEPLTWSRGWSDACGADEVGGERFNDRDRMDHTWSHVTALTWPVVGPDKRTISSNSPELRRRPRAPGALRWSYSPIVELFWRMVWSFSSSFCSSSG
jgi:hypothetical protein